MRGLRGWALAAGVAILIAIVASIAQPRQDSPEHSSNSDAANGASAARLFAQAMGHPTDQIAGDFALRDQTRLLLVLTPTSPFSSDDADRVAGWVRNGGVLVFAAEESDPELDRVLGVSRYDGVVPGSPAEANPIMDGVTRV